MMESPTPIWRTPRDAFSGTIRETVIIGEKTFLIDRPDGSDDLQLAPDVREKFIAGNFLPLWADLWPAARMLAKVVIGEPWTPNTVALEIGCGLGLAGIAAMAQGVRVLFNDHDHTALEFAAANAKLNGCLNFELAPFDWRHPPNELKVPVVLGSDLIYEHRNVEPLFDVLHQVLLPGGMMLLTDEDRPPTGSLIKELEKSGWLIERSVARAGAPGQPRAKGSLYRIRRPN